MKFNMLRVSAALMLIFTISQGHASGDNLVLKSESTIAKRLISHELEKSKGGKNVIIGPIGIGKINSAYSAISGDSVCKKLLQQGFAVPMGQHSKFEEANPNKPYESFSAIILDEEEPKGDQFFKKLQGTFELMQLPFARPKFCKEQINKLAAEKTHGLVKELDADIDSDTKFVLLDIFYFRGKWVTHFKNEGKRVFHRLNGEKIKVDCLYDNYMKIDYVKIKDSDCVRLPFKNGVALYLSKQSKHSEMPKLFDLEFIQQIKKSVQKKRFQFYVPKLTLEYKVNLKKIFAEMGLEFPAYITSFFQKNVFKTNKYGAEAASVTSMSACEGSVRESAVMYFNHPFSFALVAEGATDNNYMRILMSGVIVDPR